jgi:hypothetical protein
MGLPYETLSKLMGFLDANLHQSNVHLFSDEEMINHNKYFGQKVARNYDELIPNELIPMEDRAIMEDGMEEIMEPQVDVDNIGLRLRPVMRVLRRDMDQQEIGVGISDDGFEGFASRYDNDLDSEPQVEERG